MKPCAIVLLNYNGETVLPTFLPSVVIHSVHDLWMIDNASTDGSLDYVRKEFPAIGILPLEKNLGFTGGYNYGLEQLKGQYAYFILINTDLEVTSGWDLGLVDFLEKQKTYAAVQPKVLSWKDRSKFDHAGAGGGYIDALGYPYCRGRIWNHLEQDQGQYNDSVEVDWASGACLAICADDFFRQRGFDSQFFAHMEEIDLCWRLRQAGRKIGYLGSVAVYHLGGGTLDRNSPQKLYLNIRNSLLMLYKNSSRGQFARAVLLKAFLEGTALCAFFFKGQPKLAKAIISGYLDFSKIKKHQKTQSRKKNMASSLGPIKILAIPTLLRRVKKFTEL